MSDEFQPSPLILWEKAWSRETPAPDQVVKGSPATNDGGKGRPGNDLFIVLRDQGVVDAVDVQFAESVVVHPGAEACLGTVRGIIGVCSSLVEKRTDTNKTL